jgi:CBS domain-containing protein
MRAKEIMTVNPRCACIVDNIATVAKLMRDGDCGSIPVADDTGKLVGIVTDRDLAVRCLASGRSAETPVLEVMSAYPFTANADDDLRHVEKLMAERQVRRVPVVDASGRCIGIISQADLARAAQAKPDSVSDREVAIVVERISSPKPVRRSDPRFSETVRITTGEHRQSLSD